MAAEGLCGVAVDGHGSAVLVEINCQSDFAARGLYIYSFVCFFLKKKLKFFFQLSGETFKTVASAVTDAALDTAPAGNVSVEKFLENKHLQVKMLLKMHKTLKPN